MSSNVNTQLFRRILIRNIALPLLVGIASCGVFVIMVNQLIAQSAEVKKSAQIISKTNEVHKLFIDGETGLRGFVITDKEAYLQPYIVSRQQIDKELRELAEMIRENPAQVERVQNLRTQHNSWVKYAETIIAAEKKLRPGVMNNIIAQGVGKSLMDQARETFSDLIRDEETLRDEKNDHLNRITSIGLIAVSLFMLLSAIWIALSGRRQMMSLAESYESVLRESERHNQTLMAQQWLKAGQNELNEKIAATSTLAGLSEAILEFSTRYLSAQVGAFYVSNDSMQLERTATFAFTESAQHKQLVSVGEGLVGQVAKTAEPAWLRDLPQDYLSVSSSLGHTAPTHVLALPFEYEGRVLAVMELGFVGEAHPRCLDYYEQIEETTGVSINAAQLRAQREHMLREIQNQAEELQTQQEELRVTNEELEEQTRMLKETHVRLEAQHAEMEQTNSQLEEQTQALENQKQLLDKKNQNLFDAKLALEQKATELQRASQYKSEFLANMSHELRTPLNSSLILAKLLADNKEGNLTKQQVDFAKQIQSSGNDLLNLINDILDLSKVESGKLDIVPENISVASLLSGLQKAFSPIAKEKNLKLTFDATEVPASFYSDKLRVEQILKNLLSNAIKFTSAGEVSVRIYRADGDHLSISVKDTGIGISPEQQEVIFEAFRQADGTTNRKFGGTGLGLSISRNLAYLLGGSIKVESVIGHGSNFILTLPEKYQATDDVNLLPTTPLVAKTQTHGAKADFKMTALPSSTEAEVHELFFQDDRSAYSPQDRTVMVVEDDKKFAGILYDLAHELGYKCIVTNSAEEALRLTAKYHPTAILLDITLADRSGLYVLDQLKQHATTRHIPVHVISGSDFSRQALHMGAIGYILKPVKRSELVEAFQKIEEKIRQDIRKILIVEDNEVQREAIRRLIEDKNIETVAVGTGEKAIATLSQDSFDCMIVDLNLPDMTGFDLLEKMNSDDNQSYPPTIVYTGRELTRDEESQLQLYSHSVIIKGAKSPERLLDEVTLFLHRVESDLDVKKQGILQDLRNRDKVFEKRTVMVVDDDMRNIFALTAALEQKGARIVIAKNGQESLDKLAIEKNIDIVLMDIMMPVMDGYEAMRRIRSKPEFKNLPIIALTAKAMKDDQQRCLDAGADDYLSKPVDLEKLLSLTRIWLMSGWRA